METSGELSSKPFSTESFEHNGHVILFINEFQRQVVRFINYSILGKFISLFGIVTNLINMVIFYKQGLNSTINISFFALALSDLCGSFLLLFFNFYGSPLFDDLHMHVEFPDVQYLTYGMQRAMLSRITCLITVYITAERCLCVTFPLHVKQIITTRRTTIIIICIYITTFCSAAPIYADKYLGWRFYPAWNKTRIGILAYREKQSASAGAYFWHSLSMLLCFLTIVVLTLILMSKLKSKSAWLKAVNVQKDKSESLSKKDRTTMFMVVLIASILIVCYTPSTVLSLITVGEPEFRPGGTYHNWYYVMWSYATLFEAINSSVNIVLYLKMSSKYRHSFYEMFSCFGGS